MPSSLAWRGREQARAARRGSRGRAMAPGSGRCHPDEAIGLRGAAIGLRGAAIDLRGAVIGLHGAASDLCGEVSGLCGEASGLRGGRRVVLGSSVHRGPGVAATLSGDRRSSGRRSGDRRGSGRLGLSDRRGRRPSSHEKLWKCGSGCRSLVGSRPPWPAATRSPPLASLPSPLPPSSTLPLPVSARSPSRHPYLSRLPSPAHSTAQSISAGPGICPGASIPSARTLRPSSRARQIGDTGLTAEFLEHTPHALSIQ